MKARNLFYIIGISALSLMPVSVNAQVGTTENAYGTSNVEDQNALRIFDLEQQVKDADAELKRAQRVEKSARNTVKEAKAALRAEKQAQKARKRANDQARKAEKMMN